jgi:hypothetical protein
LKDYVIPTQAGIPLRRSTSSQVWLPACAEMTSA